MIEKLIEALTEYENKPIHIGGFIYELELQFNMPEGYELTIDEHEDGSIDVFLINNLNRESSIHLMFAENEFTITEDVEDAIFEDCIFQIHQINDRFTLEFCLN